MIENVKVVPYENGSIKGFKLELPEGLVINKGFLESRVYATEGEAHIAQGLISIRYSEFMSCNEFQLLLEAILRLAFSEKTWSNE